MSDSVVKVLQVLIGGKTFTGVASYLYQQYLHLDRSKVHYDFLFCRENAMELVMHDDVFYDSKFVSLNATRKNSSVDYRRFIQDLRKVVQATKYDYVVINTSVVELIVASLYAVNIDKDIKFVAHAHNTEIVLTKKSIRYKLKGIIGLVENINRKIIRERATYLFACSEDAGKATFGKKAIQSKKFSVIRNAIDLNEFKFDLNKRKLVRDSLEVSDNEVVYGNIGSLCVRKNQSYLLKVFKEILTIESNAKLWIIGEGELKHRLMQEAEDLKISQDVVFMGQRSDINELMQGMDCFVFTTKSEGLGIVAIEAQAAGLPTVVSDGVPDDVTITDMCLKLNLCDGEERWAREVVDFRKENRIRKDNYLKLAQAGYDINVSAQAMLGYYCK